MAKLLIVPDFILESLCYYDSRNPNNNLENDDVTEEEYKNAPGDCICDNCFYGRTKLAQNYLELVNYVNETR